MKPFSPARTRALSSRSGPAVVARPLRHGDVRTVIALFERLSERSRRLRFHGPKPCLSRSDLRTLTAIDRTRHVLVAYVGDDPAPVAIARLVRHGRHGRSAEIAFAVADEYHGRGIGSALTAELIADAREAGVTEVTALVSNGNTAAVGLLRRILDGLAITFEGTELSIHAAIA
jgi:ribosomal protein S18 acetylase RimI-like enzyme